jgi:hypothetical protein
MARKPKKKTSEKASSGSGDRTHAPGLEKEASNESTGNEMETPRETPLDQVDCDRMLVGVEARESAGKKVVGEESASAGADSEESFSEAYSLLQEAKLVFFLEQALDERLDPIRRELNRISSCWESLEILQDIRADKTKVNKRPDLSGDVPPLPKITHMMGCPKYTVERERITGTVDPVLFRLFQQDREERGVTVSRMLDIVLWQIYGQPKLSFEILDEQPEMSPKEREGVLKPKRNPGRPRKRKQ